CGSYRTGPSRIRGRSTLQAAPRSNRLVSTLRQLSERPQELPAEMRVRKPDRPFHIDAARGDPDGLAAPRVLHAMGLARIDELAADAR
ncbi:hypothetical protein ACWEO2_17255, partial [Nocardia sp. NPDC004278]